MNASARGYEDQHAWVLLSRSGCHLCDEFADELLTAFPQLAPLLRWIDVDSSDDWRERYGRSIPVLLDPRQRPICETSFVRESVAAALKHQSQSYEDAAQSQAR